MSTDYYARRYSPIWHKIPAARVTRRQYGKQPWMHTLEASGVARCGRKPGGSAVGEWIHVAASVGSGIRVCKDCEALL